MKRRVKNPSFQKTTLWTYSKILKDILINRLYGSYCILKEDKNFRLLRKYTDWDLLVDDHDRFMIKDLITDQHIIIEVDDYSDFSYLMNRLQSKIDSFMEQQT